MPITALTLSLLLGAAAQSFIEPDALTRIAAEEFALAHFAPLAARFDEPLKAGFTETKLQTAWEQVIAKAGRFEHVDPTAKCVRATELRKCEATLVFERERVTVRIAIDRDGLIADFVVLITYDGWH